MGAGPFTPVPNKYKKKVFTHLSLALGKDPIRADPWMPGGQMLGKTLLRLVHVPATRPKRKAMAMADLFLRVARSYEKLPPRLDLSHSWPLICRPHQLTSVDSTLVAWWKQCQGDSRANCWPTHSWWGQEQYRHEHNLKITLMCTFHLLNRWKVTQRSTSTGAQLQRRTPVALAERPNPTCLRITDQEHS